VALIGPDRGGNVEKPYRACATVCAAHATWRQQNNAYLHVTARAPLVRCLAHDVGPFSPTGSVMQNVSVLFTDVNAQAVLARRPPVGISDRIAFGLTRLLRAFADLFFRKRYGHRAVVLETVAAVPGMVAGMLNHLKALRRMQDDRGWIKTLLDEAENERMHLMTFIAVAQPSALERAIIVLAQGAFFNAFFLLYLFAPRTAHRLVGYFEEEAVVSYTSYLAEIDSGRADNPPAPAIAIAYWKLAPDARLRDVVIAVRADEAGHRDVNHGFADALSKGQIREAAAAAPFQRAA
jgi:ubiquinol oxidase